MLLRFPDWIFYRRRDVRCVFVPGFGVGAGIRRSRIINLRIYYMDAGVFKRPRQAERKQNNPALVQPQVESANAVVSAARPND